MKKAIQKLLKYVGYEITKVPPTPFLKKECIIQVGKFQLTLPATNPLIRTYTEQKDFASEIGRLVNYVYEKYPNLTFLDVGANTGDTVAIVKSVKDIPVISIEGDEFSFGYLKKNVSQFRNVTIFNNFLGEKKDTIPVDLQKKGWNTTIIPSSNSNNKIEIIPLDDLLGPNFSVQDLQAMKILKIDTEGFDTIIVRGAMNLIKMVKPVIFLEYNRDNMNAIGEDGLSTIINLRQMGYNNVLFYDDRGRYILSTLLNNEHLIKELHNYADGKRGLIYYYNICLFHEEDKDIALKAIEREGAL